MRFIRSATLFGLPEAIKEVGLDPTTVMEQAGLEPNELDDPDHLISLDRFLRALALAARLSGTADFAVRAAFHRGVPDLGAVSLLMREAESVKEAIGYYATHIAMHSDDFIVQIDHTSFDPVVVVRLRGGTEEESIQASLFAVAGVTMAIRWLAGNDFRPEMVSLSHPRLERTHYAQRFFSCPISFNQALSGLIIRNSDWLRPTITSSPRLRRQALKYLAPVLMPPGSFASRVARIIDRTIADGDSSAVNVAAYLDVDRRTMNRRLEKEGETFSTILQKVRVEVTLRLITNNAISLTDLAGHVGFEGLSSFSRWFFSTFGCSASDWRSRDSHPVWQGDEKRLL
ncbi:AraC family transcriptional regulator [Azorhizobium sp. AG788]|uniref:AraC family transcriptional regulator n=1 Tax=Azorhizobium sp. AG788 TaxID=2183897 RepID=UPI003139A858